MFVGFLECCKTFDTVFHHLLLSVLNTYRVMGTDLSVSVSYLNEQQQRVKIGKTRSEPLEMTIGLPQCTVLGPILFIIYLNSFTKIRVVGGSLIWYAGDTVAMFSGDS